MNAALFLMQIAFILLATKQGKGVFTVCNVHVQRKNLPIISRNFMEILERSILRDFLAKYRKTISMLDSRKIFEVHNLPLKYSNDIRYWILRHIIMTQIKLMTNAKKMFNLPNKFVTNVSLSLKSNTHV